VSQREFLQALLDTRGDGSKLCARCGCCEMTTEECEQCDEGLDGHDCGEDTCCCEFPEDNLRCQFCSGRVGTLYALEGQKQGIYEYYLRPLTRREAGQPRSDK
jgi:hypothetical protein